MSLTRSTIRLDLRCLAMLFAGAAHASEQPPTLAIGAAMPPFSLPGIDGKTYTEKSFAKADILVMVFTCAHCPTAQAYQERIKKLVTDYASKNVTLIAINPNHADAVRLDELAYSRSLGFVRRNGGARQAGKIQLRLARRRPEAGDVARLWPGRHAARVHLRQGAQAPLRRAHRRLRARVDAPPSTTRAMRWMRCWPARSRPSPPPRCSAAR